MTLASPVAGDCTGRHNRLGAVADETRRWLMTGTLALTGAAAGGVAGYLATPEHHRRDRLARGRRVRIRRGARRPVRRRLALAEAAEAGRAARHRRAEPEPEPEPEPDPDPPPPDGGEPGWYSVPDGTRRYWNGEAWTTHVWRERKVKRS